MTGLFKSILVPVDLSPPSLVAFHHSLRLAKSLKSELHVVNVVETSRDARIAAAMDTQWQAMVADGEKRVAELKEQALNDGVSCSAQVCRGFADEVLAELGKQTDLIVMGTHGRKSFDRFLLGSVTESVLRMTRVPVIGIRVSTDDPDRPVQEEMQRAAGVAHITVPFDGSDHAENALVSIAPLAKHFDATVTVVHVMPQPRQLGFLSTPKDAIAKAEGLAAAKASAALARAGLAADRSAVVLLSSDLEPADAIANFAAGNTVSMTLKDGQGKDIDTAAPRTPADLIAMGSHQRSGISRAVMGSVSEGVLRLSAIPVIVFPLLK